LSQKGKGIVAGGLDFIKRQHHNFKVNMLRVSFQNMFLQMINQFQSIYMAALGADPAQIGIANSVGEISGAAVALPTGWFADRYGPKKIFVASAIIMALGSLMFALANSWIAIIPALLLFLFGQRFGMTICSMICGKYLRSDERTMGVQLCDTTSALPTLIAPTIGAIIVTAFGGTTVSGIKPIYYLSFVGYGLISIMLLKLWDEKSVGATVKKSRDFTSGYREVFTKGTAIKRWLAFSSIVNISMLIFPIYWPLFAKQVKGVDQFLLGAMNTAQYILPLFLAIPAGKFADSFGKKKIFYFLAPLNILAPLLLIYAPSWEMLILSMVFAGVSQITIRIESSIRAELVPISLMGKFAGLNALVRALLVLPFPTIGGILYQNFGPEYVFFLIAAVRILEPLLLITIPELKRNP
jgi:MFS family permease